MNTQYHDHNDPRQTGEADKPKRVGSYRKVQIGLFFGVLLVLSVISWIIPLHPTESEAEKRELAIISMGSTPGLPILSPSAMCMFRPTAALNPCCRSAAPRFTAMWSRATPFRISPPYRRNLPAKNPLPTSRLCRRLRMNRIMRSRSRI